MWLEFYSSYNKYWHLILIFIVFLYSTFFMSKRKFFLNYDFYAMIVLLLVWSYALSIKDFIFHVIATCLLLCLVFINYFRHENYKFLKVFLVQSGIILFSYIMLMLFLCDIGKQSMFPYGIFNIEDAIIHYNLKVYFHKPLLFVVLIGIIFSSYVFVATTWDEKWFLKSSFYYLGITKIPLWLISVLFVNNSQLLKSVLSTLYPLFVAIIMLSLIMLFFIKKGTSFLHVMNNLYTSLFWLALVLESSINSSILINYIFVIEMILLFMIVFLATCKAPKDLFQNFKTSEFASSDYIIFFWIICLLPGTVGFTMLLHSVTTLLSLSIISTLLMGFFAFIAGIRLVRDIISAHGKKEADKVNRYCWPIYPLLMINGFILLYELFFGRLIFK